MTDNCFASATALEKLNSRMESVEAMLTFIPELRATISAVSRAQETMAASAESMAKTFEKFERRIEKQDERYEEVVSKLAGNDRIPLKSHYWTIAASLLPTLVLGVSVIITVLYATKQELKATMTELHINQKQNGS